MDTFEKYEKRFVEMADEATAAGDELTALLQADTVDQEAVDAVQARVAALTKEQTELALQMETFKNRMAEIDKIKKFAERQGNVETPTRQTRDLGDVYDLSTVRGVNSNSELRSRALTAVETTSDWEFDSDVSKASPSKERITWLLEHKDDRNATIAKLVLTTNSRTYKEAWAKAVTGREAMLTGPEREGLFRAMTLTDAAGGFAVPMPIDPTLIQLGDGAAAGIRGVARVEPITVDVWRGLSSTEVVASYDAEAAEVSDDTPTWAQPTVSVHMARAFVPASIEIAGDYPNLAGELVGLVADAKMRLEATVFATGTGSGQPFGIVTALDGTTSEITSTTTDVFALGDVYRTFEATGPRYRMAGMGSQAWCSNITILNLIRQFGTANNYHGFTVDLTEAGVPAILGRQWFEMSAMDGTITALADNNILVFGDFQNYLIAERVGLAMEFIPHLFATANNLPSGQRGWFAYWRNGADSVNDGAFTMLNVT